MRLSNIQCHIDLNTVFHIGLSYINVKYSIILGKNFSSYKFKASLFKHQFFSLPFSQWRAEIWPCPAPTTWLYAPKIHVWRRTPVSLIKTQIHIYNSFWDCRALVQRNFYFTLWLAAPSMWMPRVVRHSDPTSARYCFLLNYIFCKEKINKTSNLDSKEKIFYDLSGIFDMLESLMRQSALRLMKQVIKGK